MQSLRRVARNAAARLMRRSDYSRWGDPENLEKWWEERTQKMAALVPKSSRVIEFGAGSCRLRSWLDDTCEYIPSDIVARGPDTVICDLNRRPLPNLEYLQADVALFAGVLEYLGDLDAVVKWLSGFVEWCIVSYDCVPPAVKLPGRLRERFRRQYYGYLSDYTEVQLVEVFHRWGFVNVRRDAWTTQCIFVFTKARAVDPFFEANGDGDKL
jgi:hypothetical protein